MAPSSRETMRPRGRRDGAGGTRPDVLGRGEGIRVTTARRRIGQGAALATAFLAGAILAGVAWPSRGSAPVRRDLVHSRRLSYKVDKPFKITIEYKDGTEYNDIVNATCR